MANKKLENCLIVCGAPDIDIDFIKSQLSYYDYIICADSGYSYLKKLNVLPNLLVGDFDSYSDDLPNTQIVRLNTHKDDTDSIHCCSKAISLGFKNVTLLGAIGGRFDHSFANLCALQYLSENNINGRILNNTEIIEYKTKGEYKYQNVLNKTFSVFPFACKEANVSYIGKCEYPANNLTLKSSLAMGISNVFNEDTVTIKVNSGNVLIVIEDI